MKRKLFAIALICVFMLTCCTKAIELTEDQDALVAEAAAGVLVRNSYKYKSKYADYNYKNEPQETTAEPESQTPEETEPETDASGKDEKTLMLSTASKALGIEPAEVSFKGKKESALGRWISKFYGKHYGKHVMNSEKIQNVSEKNNVFCKKKGS